MSEKIPTLSELLAAHSCLKLQANNKILCKVTGHEMSARADVVHAYINGKKFKKDSQWYNYDFSEFLPYIVPDRDEKYFKCLITGQRLNRIPDEIKNHMNGKKFQRLKEEHDKETEIRKRKQQEKDERAALWVPPGEEEESESDADDTQRAKKAKKGTAAVAVTKSTTAVAKEEDGEDDEDNLSDLMGSDVESDEDDEEDDDDVSEAGKEEVEEVEEVIIRKVKDSEGNTKKVVQTTPKTTTKSTAASSNATKNSNNNQKNKSNSKNNGKVPKSEVKSVTKLNSNSKPVVAVNGGAKSNDNKKKSKK